MLETTKVRDEVAVALERPREGDSLIQIEGFVVAELFGPDGELKRRVAAHNIITAVGDAMYAARGAGVASPPAAPTGMRLGTNNTSPAKTGAGAALGTYVTTSNKAFDATYPQVSGGVVTYRCTWGPGEGTSATSIVEAVIVNDAIATNATSTAANTISRILPAVGTKGANDTLTLTWTHTLLGQ